MTAGGEALADVASTRVHAHRGPPEPCRERESRPARPRGRPPAAPPPTRLAARLVARLVARPLTRRRDRDLEQRGTPRPLAEMQARHTIRDPARPRDRPELEPRRGAREQRVRRQRPGEPRERLAVRLRVAATDDDREVRARPAPLRSDELDRCGARASSGRVVRPGRGPGRSRWGQSRRGRSREPGPHALARPPVALDEGDRDARLGEDPGEGETRPAARHDGRLERVRPAARARDAPPRRALGGVDVAERRGRGIRHAHRR